MAGGGTAGGNFGSLAKFAFGDRGGKSPGFAGEGRSEWDMKADCDHFTKENRTISSSRSSKIVSDRLTAVRTQHQNSNATTASSLPQQIERSGREMKIFADNPSSAVDSNHTISHLLPQTNRLRNTTKLSVRKIEFE